MRGWGRWVLLIGGGLFAAVLLAAGLLTYLVLRLDVRGEVERVVESATGRQLTIAGDVGVSYWPVLGLHAANATLANVEGGRAPAFITADDIHIGVELRPLLDRQVVVRSLVLQHPRIALEVDAQGRPNWVLGPRRNPNTPAPPVGTRPGQPGLDFSHATLREVAISDGEISYFDARRGAGWVVGAVNVTSAINLEQPVHMRGDFRYNDQRVTLESQIERPGAAFRGEVTPLTLHLSGDLLDAQFEGQTIAASGELSGEVRASGPNLRGLAAWTGAPIRGGVGLAQFAVTGHLDVGRGGYSFSNAGFSVDQVRGRGDFVLSQLRNKPYLSGRLQLFDFDLNPYISGHAPAPAPVAQAEAAAAMPDAATATPPAQLATVRAAPRALDVQAAPSGQPIDFSGLQAFNADLELVTAAVLVQHMRIDNSRLNLVLNDGYMAATIQNVGLYGGTGHGRFEIDARAPATRIVQDLAFDNLDARRFLTDAINFSNVEGRAELSLNVRAQGRTQEELLASVDGRTHIEVISGVLHGVDLGGVSRTIRNALRGELIAAQAQTPFQGFSGTFAISDGVFASHDLSFNTPDLRIPGIGIIDVPQRRLDLRLAPRSPRGGIVFPFSIRGPWAQPAYDSDIRDRAQREIAARVAHVEAASRASANAN